MQKLDVIFKKHNIEIRERRTGGTLVAVPYHFDSQYGISNFRLLLQALGFDVEVSDERLF